MIGFAVPTGAAHSKSESCRVNRMRCGDNLRKFNDGQLFFPYTKAATLVWVLSPIFKTMYEYNFATASSTDVVFVSRRRLSQTPSDTSSAAFTLRSSNTSRPR